jgi:hypothetical protein
LTIQCPPFPTFVTFGSKKKFLLARMPVSESVIRDSDVGMTLEPNERGVNVDIVETALTIVAIGVADLRIMS